MAGRLTLIFFGLFWSAITSTAQPQWSVTDTACPSSCQCFRTTVRCIFQQLQEIPDDLPTSTTVLDLRFNKLRRLFRRDLERLSNLQTLLLNNNELESIEPGALRPLRHLHTLHLYRNRLQQLESGSFADAPALEHLQLQHNELNLIDPQAFDGAPNLRSLYLHNNYLKLIPYQPLQTLMRLERLRLDNNPLQCEPCELASLVDYLQRRPTLEVEPASCLNQATQVRTQLRLLPQDAFDHCRLPRIVEQAPEVVGVRAGETVQLRCRTERARQTVWMRDETVLDEAYRLVNRRYQQLDDGTLVLRDVDRSVAGRYECMAKSALGVVRSRRTELTFHSVMTAPRIFRAPSDAEAELGGGAELRCESDGEPTPTVVWWKDGRRLADGQTLLLTNVGKRDAGLYTCQAGNRHGSVNASASVKVRFAPEFTLTPEQQQVIEGTRVALRCEANAYPPATIQWTKDGRQLGQSRGANLEAGGSLLVIYPFLRQDVGQYVCHAKNALGERQVSAELTTAHSTPPSMVTAPAGVTGRPGETVNFQCRATGVPQPKIVWHFNGSPVPTVVGHYEISALNTLYVNDITSADDGYYTCQAANEVGAVSADAKLSVVSGQDDSISSSSSSSSPSSSGAGNAAATTGHRSTGLSGSGSPAVTRQVIEDSVRRATLNVDRAIGETRRRLFDGRPKSPSEVLALLRFPGPQAVELARAREVYEQTLRLVQEHVAGGLSFNLSQFRYEDILSPAHLQLISELSGCSVHRERQRCQDMCFHGKYRNYDGTCNNLQRPHLGSSLTPFKRLLPSIYENGFDMPVGWDPDKRYAGGFRKPNPRTVSTRVIATRKESGLVDDPRYSHMLMQWGQFLDHDLDFAILAPSLEQFQEDGISCKLTCRNSPPCFNIDVPEDDPRIDRRNVAVPCIELERSSAVCGSGETSVFFNAVQPREQVNQITSFIDASNVYGSNEEDAVDLRDLFSDHGLLKFDITSHRQKPYLPFNRDHAMDCRRNQSVDHAVRCFWAGDHRANEQLGLLSMHTLWLREHNRIAGLLLQINPHWDGERIYQESRKIVGAQMQHITYADWLPKVLGPDGMRRLGAYNGYDSGVDPSISNEFATAALRFGHTLIQPTLFRLNASFQPIEEGHLPLHKAFFAPERLLQHGGIDPLLRGLFASPAKLLQPDQVLNRELTEKLFSNAQMGLDLSALNIQRGRDHALDGYAAYRRFCNLSATDRFDSLAADIRDPDILRKLQSLYGHPDNVDLWVGGVSEAVAPGARTGPLFVCLLADQFRRLRDGDRFWYENAGQFSASQLAELKRSSLARVLCDNGDEIDRAQPDVFQYVGPGIDNYKPCSEIPEINLNMWQECCESTCGARGRFSSEKLDDSEEESDQEQPSSSDGGRHSAGHRYKREWNSAAPPPETDNVASRLEQLERQVQRLQKQRLGTCVLADGRIKSDGQRWASDSCSECWCGAGEIRCRPTEKCPPSSDHTA